MANQIEQLSHWMLNRAKTQGLSIDQLKAVTQQQLHNALPAQYQERLTEIVFLKARRQAVLAYYAEKLDELRQNTSLRQEVLAVFPQATFSIVNTGTNREIRISV